MCAPKSLQMQTTYTTDWSDIKPHNHHTQDAQSMPWVHVCFDTSDEPVARRARFIQCFADEICTCVEAEFTIALVLLDASSANPQWHKYNHDVNCVQCDVEDGGRTFSKLSLLSGLSDPLLAVNNVQHSCTGHTWLEVRHIHQRRNPHIWSKYKHGCASSWHRAQEQVIVQTRLNNLDSDN